MVVFSLKLLNNVRKAIAGRKFPHQLAGGLALGVLLGIIPHGNLLALIVLVTVLCFQVNHAMMGIVAIAASFGATRLDDYSHRIGEALLMHPTGNQIAERAWALPLVPWTDLNNTVVLGSFVIGVFATLPIFLITLPLFRLIAPKSAAKSAATETADDESNKVSVDDPVFVPVETVETRIDVIRMQDYQPDEESSEASDNDSTGIPEQPMDEALTYLLHQLRHSQQRKAAG